MKRGPKLNLIKKIWRKGGGGNPTTLTVSSLVSEIFFFWGGGEGGGLGTETKTVCQMQLPTQCRACGTINISKYINIFLSTNPTTFILSSLVSEF